MGIKGPTETDFLVIFFGKKILFIIVNEKKVLLKKENSRPTDCLFFLSIGEHETIIHLRVALVDLVSFKSVSVVSVIL